MSVFIFKCMVYARGYVHVLLRVHLNVHGCGHVHLAVHVHYMSSSYSCVHGDLHGRLHGYLHLPSMLVHV